MNYPEKAIREAVYVLGDIALNTAKENCPVRTGRLKNSIRITKHDGRATETPDAVIGTDVEYARFVELGGRKNAPANFLGRAAEEARKNAPAVFSLFLRGDHS